MTTGRALPRTDDRTDAELLRAHLSGGDPAACFFGIVGTAR